MNVKFASALSATTLLALATFGWAQTPVTEYKPGGSATASLTHTATVVKIDAKDRWVTLKMDDGSMLDIQCGPEVKNFAQIKVHDRVTFTQQDTVSIDVVPAGQAAPAVSSGSAVTSAPLGAKPMGVKVDTTMVSGAVTAIDYGKRLVTLKGPDGNSHTLEVGPAAKKFSLLKVGDVVVMTLKSASTIQVLPPAK